MTGNCKTLALLADEPGFVRMNPADAQARGIKNGDICIHIFGGAMCLNSFFACLKGTIDFRQKIWVCCVVASMMTIMS